MYVYMYVFLSLCKLELTNDGVMRHHCVSNFHRHLQNIYYLYLISYFFYCHAFWEQLKKTAVPANKTPHTHQQSYLYMSVTWADTYM